jgi:hypothetical protein
MRTLGDKPKEVAEELARLAQSFRDRAAASPPGGFRSTLLWVAGEIEIRMLECIPSKPKEGT